MTKRIILPKKEKTWVDTPRIMAPQPVSHPKTFPFTMPLKSKITPFSQVGFEKGSLYMANESFKHSEFDFKEGETYEVLGTRKFGPMAALEVIFRELKSGEKKFWVLHHNRHDYTQTKFSKVY